MKILVFCGTRNAVCEFHGREGWKGATNQFDAGERKRVLKWFIFGPSDAKLAVDRSFIVGWRAPPDTIVLFDKSWPWHMDSAESIQAIARVGL